MKVRNKKEIKESYFNVKKYFGVELKEGEEL
jgi:hypothetical protein